MKSPLEQLLRSAVSTLLPENADTAPEVVVERTRDAAHGHFSCNVAMRMAKPLKKAPRDIAAEVLAALPDNDLIESTDVAGPGFINFRLQPAAFHSELEAMFDSAESYGSSDIGAGKKVLVEFVSANPTGPLHVGHGRHAAYGACVANLLAATGHAVQREYYVNDAGRQMDILALSVWLRHLQANDHTFDFPGGAYQGDYIMEIASSFQGSAQVPDGLFDDLPDDDDAELDLLIERARSALGEDGFEEVLQLALQAILGDIREDLAEFGVKFDEWFSEKSLTGSGDVQKALDLLAKNKVTYEKDGAIWFRATDYDDEKDRVVVRDNGRTTYFASDIAYHLQKRGRGFTDLIDIWGADHHGYIPRVRAGMEAMGQPSDCLHVELVQFVALYRGGEKAQMSTRSGEFITLRQLREEVGDDAARLFFVMRSNEQHLDFDLDLAKSSSNENPVYYLQYAHARVCSVMRQLEEKGYSWDEANARDNLTHLSESHEESLMLALTKFPETVEAAALQRAPQHIVHYLKELAQEFHAYYNAHKFIVEDAAIRDARLMLVLATRQVMRNGLSLLGVNAPEHM
ncbi:MAG: arginine--tRNA ligase [Gammaproteobacteria bacterium]